MKPGTLAIFAAPLAFFLASTAPATAQSIYAASPVTEYAADGTTYLTNGGTASVGDNADSQTSAHYAYDGLLLGLTALAAIDLSAHHSSSAGQSSFTATMPAAQTVTIPTASAPPVALRPFAAPQAQTLYVANSHNNTIEKFDSSGVGTQFNTSFTSGSLNGPIGLAFDSTGNLYAANAGNNTIEKFNTSGVGTQFNTSFTSGSLSSPYGVTFDSTGNLYVANAGNNTIEKFNSSGVGTQFNTSFTSGSLNGPTFLAFAPVAAPEPSPAAILGLGGVGLGVLALQARRRKVTA